MRKREFLMGNNGLSGLQVIVGFVIVLQGKKMDKQKSVKARKEAKSTTQQRGPSFSGYNLFIEEFYVHKKENQKDSKKDKQKGKGKTRDNFKESNLVVREAWNQLSEKERAEYKKRAEKLRAPGKGKSYVLPFMTRCAPKQCMAVCKNLKERLDVMKRLKRIGFDKLVEISCPQINRALYIEFMRCFDPPTKQVTIRGETRGVGPEDVRQILGLPKGGTDIRVEVDDGNVVFNNLRTVYKNLKYQTIGELLNGEADENFEFLFVVFALGTLLAPTASIYVTDRVLKVITVTKEAVDKFDWSSFVFKELSIAIGEYQRELKKGKGQGIKTVGGCIYFLMMFCFQHFGLGKVRGPKDEDALTFWNEERVKIRVQTENESRRGLLYGLKHGVGQSSTTFNPETMLTHPELRRTYDRLVSMVGEELLALQKRLLDDKNIEEDEDNGSEEGDDEEDKEEAQDISSENDGSESEDKEEEKEKEEHDKKEAADAASEEVDDQGYDHSIQIEDVGGQDGGPAEEKEVHEVEHGEKQKEGSKLELRRSKRAITASWVVKSPWIDTTKKSKGKRKVDDKDTLFQMCTTTCSEEEGDE